MTDEILADADKALKLADEAANGGRQLHNLRLAINGKGTHTWQTQAKVWEQIKNSTTKEDVREALGLIGGHFEQGDIIAEFL